MSRAAGVHVTESHVRIAVLRSSYRRLELEALLEESVEHHANLDAAVAACFARVPAGVLDSLGMTVPSSRVFSHRIELPLSAEKRLAELLPFELEGEMPVEVSELVYDHQATRVGAAGQQSLLVLVVAARKQQVEQAIARFVAATGQQPERVGASAFELAQLARLCPELAVDSPLVLVDLGRSATDLCVLRAGRAEYARSLTLGLSAFPERAEVLVAQLRQSLSAYSAQSDRDAGRMIITGEGAALDGLCPYLAGHLGIEVELLPRLALEPRPGVDLSRQAEFSLALATAAHGLRGGAFDLRRGELAFERGYGHLKQRAPLVAGLLGAVLVAFLFSTWAEGQALAGEHASLTAGLEALTKETFGEALADPDEAEARLETARGARPEDPMPYLDGFGAAVALAETLPAGLVHDVEEFDFSVGKLKLRGVVGSADQAQAIAKALGEHRCVDEPKVTKISQVVNGERQRYQLEAALRCPEEAAPEK
jgi:Tfp pilus assembly PilM family ATPase